ncbi:MAG: hypothetical protein AB2693_07345 [Candidatus Thiodiazotropha sp.]
MNARQETLIQKLEKKLDESEEMGRRMRAERQRTGERERRLREERARGRASSGPQAR